MNGTPKSDGSNLWQLPSKNMQNVSAFHPQRKETQLDLKKKIESNHHHIEVLPEKTNEKANENANEKSNEEYEDLTRKDINKRTVLHRNALDHQLKVIKDLIALARQIKPDDSKADQKNKDKNQEEAKKTEEEKKRIEDSNVRKYVNEMDAFGNSSLSCACIKPDTGMEKTSCIQELLRNGAEPNIQNADTLWTPLTWCAFYGEVGPVSTLLKAGSYPFLPDRNGLYPLDHCGLQV